MDETKAENSDAKPASPTKIWPYPGDINVATVDGRNFSGCKAVEFESVDNFNAYFAAGGPAILGLLIDWRVGPHGEVIALFTRQLSPEEQQDFNEVSVEVEAAMRERREKRAERAGKEAVLNAAAAKEDKRLVSVGRDYEKRVANLKALPPGKDRKALEKKLNAGEFMRLDAQVEVLTTILDTTPDTKPEEIVAVLNAVCKAKREERAQMLTIKTEQPETGVVDAAK